MINGTQYGFDLTLYAEIDEQSIRVVQKIDFYEVEIKKKYPGIWPRLLSSLNKANQIFVLLLFSPP